MSFRGAEERFAAAPSSNRPGLLRRGAHHKDGGGVAVVAVRTALAFTLAVSIGSPVSAEGSPPAAMTGAAARDLIVGNTLDGTTADGPYSLFFATDGHLVSSDRDGRVDGTWVFRDGKFCTALSDEEEECRTLEVSGPAGVFVDTDGSRYPFVIAPGNPKAF